MTATGYSHGGDVERAAREAGIPVERILDFSANVNPMGLPAAAAERLAREARDPRLWSQYPSPHALELRTVLSRQLEVPIECIVIGAGADALIHAAVRALQPRRCLIPVPAFCEYERACHAYGCTVQRVALRIDSAMDRIIFESAGPGDLAVLNNPHNPTGACMSRARMLDCMASLKSCGASVLADEAFVDYAPAAAITREAAAQSGIIAVRSLTKFYGCPGLRVGYAVAAPETAGRLAAHVPAWPVTTLALNALAEALRDRDYVSDTLARNDCARSELSAALHRLGCYVYPSAANFLFVQVPKRLPAGRIRERLIREHGILVRECDSFAGIEPGRYLRLAVRLESENARLVEALANVFEGS